MNHQRFFCVPNELTKSLLWWNYEFKLLKTKCRDLINPIKVSIWSLIKNESGQKSRKIMRSSNAHMFCAKIIIEKKKKEKEDQERIRWPKTENGGDKNHRYQKKNKEKIEVRHQK